MSDDKRSPETSRTILLVDDSQTSLMMEQMVLSSVLAAGSYRLVTAKNGREAVEKAAELRPDLILLDVVMPEMDGFEACVELRRREETRLTPVILVTTRGNDKDVERGFASGCTDYVTKPFSAPELLEKVRNCLGA